MVPLFVFSGLGADESAFQFLNFGEYQPRFVDWIAPIKNETIEMYARRLSEEKGVLNTIDKPILLGLSFGGLIAIEVAKYCDVEKVILLSSIKTKESLPLMVKVIGRSGMVNILPIAPIITPNCITNFIFGTKDALSKKILYEILKNTDRRFMKWAITALSKWKNQTPLDQCVSIHGTKDNIFHYRKKEHEYAIEGGGHLMVLTHAEEISDILKKELIAG